MLEGPRRSHVARVLRWVSPAGDDNQAVEQNDDRWHDGRGEPYHRVSGRETQNGGANRDRKSERVECPGKTTGEQEEVGEAEKGESRMVQCSRAYFCTHFLRIPRTIAWPDCLRYFTLL